MSLPAYGQGSDVTLPGLRQSVATNRRRIPVAPLNITGTGTGSAQTVVTAPEPSVSEIKYATATNTTGTAATLTIHVVASGASAASGNMVLNTYNVPANTTLSLAGLFDLYLAPGNTVQVYSGTTGALNFAMGLET